MKRRYDGEMSPRVFLACLLSGVLLLNLFAIGLTAWSIKQNFDLHHGQAQVNTQNLARSLESELLGRFRTNEMALFAVQDELSRRRSHGGVNSAELNAYIEQVRSRLPDIDAIRVTDAQGFLLYGTGVEAERHLSLADRPHFIALRDNPQAGLVFSGAQISRVNGKLVIALARRIADEQGRFAGMVFAAAPLENLTRIFAGMDLGEHGVVSMRDEDMVLLAHHRDGPPAGGQEETSPEMRRLIAAGAREGTYLTAAPADGIERTVSFRKVGDSPFYVAVGRATRDYLADMYRDAWRIALLLVLFASIISAFAVLVYRAWHRQRQLNLALRDSESRLNELFENMHSGVAVYRASDDGREFFFVGFNRTAERVEKIRREELLGKNVVEVFPGIVALGLLDVLRRVWKTGVAEAFPLSFYHDGRIAGWRENYVYKLPTGEVVAIYEDATERKQIEESLRRSEALFRAITDTSPLAIYMSSGVGQRAEYVNPMFIKLFGYTMDEVPTVAEWWPRAYPDEAYRNEIAEEWQRRVAAAIENCTAIEPIEAFVACKDGSRKYISWGFVSIGDQNWAFGLDLTERKQVEEAARIGMERLNEAQRIARVGNWELEIATGKLFWSEEIFVLFEIDRTQFGASYEAFLNAIHPDDREMVNQAYTRSLETRTPYEISHRLLMADGRIKWVTERCETLYDEQGKAVLSSGTVQDVTERKLAQDELESLNRDFVALLENTSDFIYFKDKDSRIRFCSQSMAAIVGHRNWRELIGKHDLEIFPAETAQIYYEEELPVFREGAPLLDKTNPYFDEQGERRWVNTNKWPVFGADGKTVVGIFGISRDITEQVRAKEALARNELLLRTIFNALPVGVWVTDAQGDILTCNEAGRKIWAGARYVGVAQYGEYRAWWHDSGKLVTPEEWGLARAVSTGEVSLNEVLDIQCFDDSRKIISNSCMPLRNEANEITGALAVVQDITERIGYEKSLKEKTADLQRSNADLERFAYSVSHDMRQPLRAISGHLQLLERSLKDKLDEDERENMRFALDGARRMDSMIVSLLDYSRVGRKTEEKKWLSGRAALDEALAFLEPMIRESGAQIEVGGEWPQVFASRDELTRLFQNLLGNGIKFCEPGKTPQLEVESGLDGEIWRVRVRDHGIGIDPAQSGRLFLFFSRLQSRARFEGNGMGLALCRRIVDHHGGRIWAESEGEGKGSTFCFEMPLSMREEEPVQNA